MTREDAPALASIAHARRRTETILRAQDLRFRYPAQGPGEHISILEQASFRVRPGQKIGLIGRNGCGKTTLLRMLAEILAPDKGTLWVNPGVRTGYLAQMLEGLDPEKSAADNISSETGLSTPDARDLLGRLGIMRETPGKS